MEKTLSRALLALYLLFLLWLVLFKSSVDFAGVLADYQSRSLNLIPFVDYSSGTISETISNFIVFVPLGLLLGINFKQSGFWQKLSFVFLFSLVAETLQFVLAIGTSDITDVITNSLGGLFGLAAYSLGRKFINGKSLDRFFVVAIAMLLVVFLLLRFLVFKVRY